MIALDIPEDRLTVHEVTGGNTARLDDLVTVFVELFPQYAHRQFRLRDKAYRPANADPLFIEHQWLAEVDGQAAGMITF